MTPLIDINCIGRRHPMMRTNEIPYWEKYMLTQREAAEYFHIGENIINDWIYEFRCDIMKKT
ncbi:MAG: hypothetical protein E7438_04000 [Ruminococcaceae bacterium]|nr:hypothetical protein [Oscillospiraceae bacterium]